MDGKKTDNFKLLLDSLDEFADMQAVHLQYFRGGQMANISIWQQQRENCGRLLKHCFDKLAIESCDPDDHRILLLQEKMGRIQRVEGELTGLVDRQRVIAKEKIGKIRKGKKVLSGYSIKGAVTSPRFLSSRS